MKFDPGSLLLAWVMLGLLGCGEPPANRAGTPASSVPFGSLPEPSDDLRRRLANPGVDGLTSHFVGGGNDELLLVELDPAKFDPVLIGVPRTGTSAEEALRDHRLAVVLGSGFVAELNGLVPVGLLQVQGQTLSPLQAYGYTRILGINDQGIGVVHRNDYQRDLFHSALQVGPGIIEQGKLDISAADLERPKYFRSFLAICAARWVAGVSLAPTHLRTLGQTLEDFFEASQWRCDDVVNLAGDRQAVLLLATGDQTVLYHGDPGTYKASLLGFRSQR
ncbi:MAG: hypothetical protein RIC56_10950 [Pseudomonadales bacterium]